MATCQTLSWISYLNYVKVLVLLENRQSWRETLGSKFVSLGCSTLFY